MVFFFYRKGETNDPYVCATCLQDNSLCLLQKACFPSVVVFCFFSPKCYSALVLNPKVIFISSTIILDSLSVVFSVMYSVVTFIICVLRCWISHIIFTLVNPLKGFFFLFWTILEFPVVPSSLGKPHHSIFYFACVCM